MEKGVQMALPNDIVLVRHGQSEANVIQGMFKSDPAAVAPPGFFDRHDSNMRLSEKGIAQAEATGEWLRSEFPDGFDRYFTSPLDRTVETAGRLALHGDWQLRDLIRERDWGEYGVLNDTEREAQYQISHKLRGQNKWYWCPPGGESLATGVHLRFRNILGTLHREKDEKGVDSVIMVTHGELIDVARFALENLSPKEWLQQDDDPAYKIANCQVLHYTRTDPETGEQARHVRWRRSICAWDEDRSWQAGEWVAIDRKTYSDEMLLSLAKQHPPLLGQDS